MPKLRVYTLYVNRCYERELFEVNVFHIVVFIHQQISHLLNQFLPTMPAQIITKFTLSLGC